MAKKKTDGAGIETLPGELATIPELKEPIAEFPGVLVEQPNILVVGPGNLFQRMSEAGTFPTLLARYRAHLSVAGIESREEVVGLPDHPNVEYYDTRSAERRGKLLFNRIEEAKRWFTHIYVANWPHQHLLTAVKYSVLAHGGLIIITKPLDLNIPLVETIHNGAFPDIRSKLLKDDHYRNKGPIRALHRFFPRLTERQGELRGFRMWLVEPDKIPDKRLPALECGVIWDLVTHLISFIQLFFLDYPHFGLLGYVDGDAARLGAVKLEINKVLRMRYMGCKLSTLDTETLAVIEVLVSFEYKAYDAKWHAHSIKGLLVAGKGATRGQGIQESAKQLDFWFHKEPPVNLNYDSGRLLPPYDEFNAFKREAWFSEKGFGLSVVELLSRSNRQLSAEEQSRAVRPAAGRYHCGVPFEVGYENVMLIAKIRASGKELLSGYDLNEAILTVLQRLDADGHLSKGWLDDDLKYGTFV